VVSWNEAAERNESVASEAFVIPRMTSVYSGGAFFAFFSGILVSALLALRVVVGFLRFFRVEVGGGREVEILEHGDGAGREPLRHVLD